MPKPYIIHVANSKLCRVVYSDGHISDLVNESRAKDAVAKLLEDYERERRNAA